MATKMIKAWVDGVAQNIEIEDITSHELAPNIDTRLESLESSVPRISEITLLANGWVGDISPYSQAVEIEGITNIAKLTLNQVWSSLIYSMTKIWLL